MKHRHSLRRYGLPVWKRRSSIQSEPSNRVLGPLSFWIAIIILIAVAAYVTGFINMAQ